MVDSVASTASMANAPRTRSCHTMMMVTSMTLPGVTISPSLNWDAHVKKVVSKANTKRYFLAVLRHAGTSLNS